MSTILTDDELPPLQPQDHPEPHSFAWTEQEMRAIRARDRLVEAAVLAKLREQEPVAWWFEARHIDSAWTAAVSLKHPGPEGVYMRNVKNLYPSPLPAVVQVPDDVFAYAKVMQQDGYRGPLAWAKTIIDWVAAAPEAPAQASEVDEREAFDRALSTKPEARFWNATDAMFWAWQARAALARKAQA